MMVRYFGVPTISIHALREEGDRRRREKPRGMGKISIHALREEGDTTALPCNYFRLISIHALREEGDDHAHPEQ